MARWIAAFLFIGVAFTLTGAQEPQKAGPITAVQDDDGAWTWTLPQNENVRIWDILHLYAKSRDVTILYNPAKVRTSLHVAAGSEKQLTGKEIETFVHTAVATNHLILYPTSEGRLELISTDEAAANARTVISEEVLRDCDPWQLVAFLYVPEHAEPDALRKTLQDLTTRQGGVINPVSGVAGLLIVDHANRVREIVKLATKLDAEMATTIKSYDVPASTTPEKAAEVLTNLLAEAASYRHQKPTFAAVTGEKRIMARGTAKLHEEVPDVLKELSNE